MGGSQSTVSATEEFLPADPSSFLEHHAILKEWSLVEGGAFAGSGQRMYKSYRVRRNPASTTSSSTTSGATTTAGPTHSSSLTAEVVAVLKVAFLPQQAPLRRTNSLALSSAASPYSNEPTTMVYQQQLEVQLQAMARELLRIQELTHELPHVWPTVAWYGPQEGLTNHSANTHSASIPPIPESSNGGESLTGGTSTGKASATTIPTTASTTTTASSSSLATATTSTSSLAGGFVIPAIWMRPHVYTTLGDRLTNRPWLDATEKLFLIHQLLLAVQSLHDVGLVHGSLTTQNIGYTSQGWLVLLDIMPTNQSGNTRNDRNHHKNPSLPLSFRPTILPDDDPTEYLYCFSNQTCYLAPERFDQVQKNTRINSNTKDSSLDANSASASVPPSSPVLTPAMDIFSLGCCLVEVVLNGEACFDLGQLLEYRKMASAAAPLNSATSPAVSSPHAQTLTPAAASASSLALTQKLQKMESSALRAACRHMLSLDPSVRLSARDYLERLQEQGCMPPSRIFDTLYQLLRHQQSLDSPDARFYHLYQAYPDVLFLTMGVRVGRSNPTPNRVPRSAPTTNDDDDKPTTCSTHKNESVSSTEPRSSSPSDLWTETEALLKELREFNLNSNDDFMTSSLPEQKAESRPPVEQNDQRDGDSGDVNEPVEDRTALEKSCILIYVQQILSTIRHVQRPATKLIAMQLIQNMLPHVSDEARLQRIVPVMVALLKDSDALVRARALHTLTRTLVVLTSFPPSDAQVMPQYIFKRVAPLLTDPCLSVRVALAQCMGGLAETAQRFLDISQAVRLVQAVEGNSGAQTPNLPGNNSAHQHRSFEEKGIFEEKVTQLLDETPSSGASSDAESSSNTKPTSAHPRKRQPGTTSGTIMVRSSYQTERSGLAETLSRWVVHICTDQSENASMVKRALLSDALEGLCNFFSLDGVMAFMLPQLLAFLNDRQDWQLRAALFAGLPVVCQIIGRGATEEFVLPCIEIGLVDNKEQVIAEALSCLARLIEHALLSRALVLPDTVRGDAIQNMGVGTTILDRYSAFLIHPSKGIRRSAVKVFCATCRALGSPDGVVYITPVLRPFLRFQPSWNHLSSEQNMIKCIKSPWTRSHFREQLSYVSANNRNTQWTDVGIISGTSGQRKVSGGENEEQKETDPMNERMQLYLKMLTRHSVQGETQSSTPDHIEGSIKLAQSVVFPRRSQHLLPEWYQSLRERVEREDSSITEASAIRSVSALGNVYGLSIMGPPTEGATDNIIGAADIPDNMKQETNPLDSPESHTMEQAFMGKWEAEVLLDPDLVDTSLLLTKLRALRVPALPPPLGGNVSGSSGSNVKSRSLKDTPPSFEWKPKVNAMIASSSRIAGHTAPVVRLAVSLDGSFFVSGSHDGTCGVWEVPRLEHSSGYLERSTVYHGHSKNSPTRVNDVAMVEGTYSVVSGASNGSIHVWRVDLVSPPRLRPTSPVAERRERSRVVGTTAVRESNPEEGEVLAVSHFTSVSNSVVVYATQKGVVHTWDLRCAEEPFSLYHGPKLGHLSAIALGGDRNWIVTGMSRGFLALWDVRFQQPFKLWKHSKGAKINRLAASFVPPPQVWGAAHPSASSRPYVFVGSQPNECSMFDVLSGSCVQCFRTEPHDTNSAYVGEEIPSLVDVSGRMRLQKGVLNVINEGFDVAPRSFAPSVNCIVGSIGGQNNSFLLTGGSDGFIRSWDFSVPSRSYTISGSTSGQPRPTFERVDFDGSRKRLIVCRQPRPSPVRPFLTGNQGLRKPEYYHTDSIEDLKIVENSALISCSRDCTIKVWR